VNCSAIPEELIESELFGYEEGAFTGAKRGGKPGKFLLADGGTIFLDEIGDLPISMQGKLLRVLQEREIEPVGAVKIRRVDVRIIAATHLNLQKMVYEGKFRQDLFYRLNVIPIMIPPLRERKEDLPLLTTSTLENLSHDLGVPLKKVSQEVMNVFLEYHWPGNIRELANVLERCVVVSEKETIGIKDLPYYLIEMSKNSRDETIRPLDEATKEVEINLILKALESADGNKVEAAHILGIHRANLYRKMEKYGIHGM